MKNVGHSTKKLASVNLLTQSEKVDPISDPSVTDGTGSTKLAITIATNAASSVMVFVINTSRI